jgi:hypothetical protein
MESKKEDRSPRNHVFPPLWSGKSSVQGQQMYDRLGPLWSVTSLKNIESRCRVEDVDVNEGRIFVEGFKWGFT